MMDVLLASIALWRGRASECVERSTEARRLFRSINDAWGEAQAVAPLARALGSLGRFDEFEDVLASLDAVAARVADKNFARFVPTIASVVATQMGDAAGALEHIEDVVAPITLAEMGNSDRAIAYAGALIQNERVDEALEFLEPGFDIATDDGPRAALGGMLAITFAAAGRADDARRVAAEVAQVSGGTYSDRMWRCWGEGFARLQQGEVDSGIAALDEAFDLAAATDSVVDQAIAALALAVGLAAVGDARAEPARADANRRLRALGISGEGWERVFTLASRTVATAP
jgi:thioredoxin-like negative regulator of GroEL